ncbi:hypothetical protein D3C77_635050 [compost metagenome]
MPVRLNTVPALSETEAACKAGPPVPAPSSRMVLLPNTTSPATRRVAGAWTDSVPRLPATNRLPESWLAAPVVPSPYCSVPPDTWAEPPSLSSTTSLPPDTVVLPVKPPLSPVNTVVPAS